MSAPEPRPPAPHEDTAFMLLLVAVSLAFGWILLPLFAPILWACVIAMLFEPLHARLLRRRPGWRTGCALMTLAVVVTVVVLPLALVLASVAREAALVYARVDSGEWNPAQYFRGVFDALPGWVLALLERFGVADFEVLQRRLTLALAQGSQTIATGALSIGQNTFEVVAGLFIMMYLAFFLIRDGERLAAVVRRAIPLAPAHKRGLLDVFLTVVRAIVKGHLLVAAVQGLLGGLAFWVLGVGAALLWGVMMGLLSLLPIVGAALVWMPVALYFLATGAVLQGLALMAWGLVVVGLADNVLRPMLVGKDTHLPDAVVMITTLGGIAVFGLHGLVLGPVIAALFVAVWQLYASRSRETPP
jgi:predicted PurR-regulated permease PerM